MILVVDIGNTNIKLGIFDGDELVDTLRLASVNKTGDEYWLLIKDMLRLKGIEPKQIDGAIMSSVNPNINYTFEHMISSYFFFKPLIVGAKIKTGINVKYDNPKEVGSDRIVNAVAAYYTYGGPCIVVDCGTATTFNVVSEKGEFLGGAISFGLKAASESLIKSAAKLPNVELTVPPAVVCKTTVTNLQSGLMRGYAGMVRHLINEIKTETGYTDAKIISTGGISETVYRLAPGLIDIVDRTLTLRGLNIIYKLNKK